MGNRNTPTTTTPPAFVFVGIATGAAFIAGGFLTAVSSSVRWSFAIAGAMLILLGAFTVYIITRANRYAHRIEELEALVLGPVEDDEGENQDRSEGEPAPILRPSFTSAVDYRPERPTASLRLG